MARKRASVVYLDTHIVLWLYDALTDRLSLAATNAINNNDVRVSAMVRLELQYLYELDRVSVQPSIILGGLAKSLGLQHSNLQLDSIVAVAEELIWTRDVFDRLISAEALMTGYGLVSKDREIRKHLPVSIW